MDGYISKFKQRFEVGMILNDLPAKITIQIRQNLWDIVLICVLATLAAVAAYQGAQLINPILFDNQASSVWFEADVSRVFNNMVDRKSDHYRVKVHPLFSLLAFPPVLLLKKLFSLEPDIAVAVVIAAVAVLWIATLFTLLRLIGCHRLDAMLFSILATVSAGAMFWFVVPETYSFGSLTILLGLCFVVFTEYRQFSSAWYVGVSAMTLSMTTTNWMAGILATIVNHPKKRALQITINTLCLVVLLWTVQKIIFRSAVFFLGDREEESYMLMSSSGGPLHILKSFIAHTMVMPAINVDAQKYAGILDFPIMLTQLSQPGSGTVWGMVAVVLWTALLGLGVWGFFSGREHGKFRIVMGLTLLGNLVLHLLYGDETFLYSLHFVPLLILLAAYSTFTRARAIALLLTGALIVTAGTNNFIQFHKAVDAVNSLAPQRHQVLQQMRLRPQDPWPRGTGHVVLAAPGSLEVDKAYHEPGGSFSPSVGSFGVSLWLTDQAGNLQTTSDSIPLKEIDQQLNWNQNQTIPGILTKTKYYQAQWSAKGSKAWQLHLKTQPNPNLKPQIVIRSVGPAGGAIKSLNWDGKQLLINQHWSVTLNTTPTKVYLGEEGHKGWVNETSKLSTWSGKNGWGYARFELANGNNWNLEIEDIKKPATPTKVTFSTTQPGIDLNLPDKQFTASLNAQVAHLMMGLVGKQTRPGEPTNYPLAWQRDGAYTVVALARAGKLQDAQELANYFAKNDFFGGFGAEADAPGLSIWALSEVAQRLKQPKYDQSIWPDVRRKAEFILKMMTTTEPIYHSFSGPVVPKEKPDPEVNLVAEPARNGLIIGRMDGHRPLMFVNAVSYRGLMDAASLAERMNQPADALRWRDAAKKLQQAWEKALQTKEADNDRTYISALWQTSVGVNQKDAIVQGLEKRWQKLRDAQGGFRSTPLWTYFDVAESHQWLFVNQPERLWTTLRWFWNNQASPGLYTWWEGHGEENSFKRWQKVRGWVKPQHVTPHYWTAAEMLLLQLDMLAYSDLDANQPTVVIGAGIPQNWLNQPMSVGGLPMPNGKLDWQWDGKQMRVKITGDKVNIRLGSVFPTGTPLQVEKSLGMETN